MLVMAVALPLMRNKFKSCATPLPPINSVSTACAVRVKALVPQSSNPFVATMQCSSVIAGGATFVWFGWQPLLLVPVWLGDCTLLMPELLGNGGVGGDGQTIVSRSDGHHIA